MPFDKLIQLIASAKHFYFMSRMNDDDGDGDGRIGTYIIYVVQVAKAQEITWVPRLSSDVSAPEVVSHTLIKVPLLLAVASRVPVKSILSRVINMRVLVLAMMARCPS